MNLKEQIENYKTYNEQEKMKPIYKKLNEKLKSMDKK